MNKIVPTKDQYRKANFEERFVNNHYERKMAYKEHKDTYLKCQEMLKENKIDFTITTDHIFYQILINVKGNRLSIIFGDYAIYDTDNECEIYCPNIIEDVERHDLDSLLIRLKEIL